MVILRRMGYESLRIDCNISYCVICAMHGHLTVTLMSRSCILSQLLIRTTISRGQDQQHVAASHCDIGRGILTFTERTVESTVSTDSFC